MATTEEESRAKARHTTGVQGLDSVLGGGLLPSNAYIVRGPPGAGKTILANQICFHRASLGHHSLYVTVPSESTDRLISQLRGLDFFDAELMPQYIYYESVTATLDKEGFPGILQLLASEQKAHDASLIVLDGLFVLAEDLAFEREFRRFVGNLAGLAQVTGATILLLTNSKRRSDSTEFTMVDGWIDLNVAEHAFRSFHYIQVCKQRGSGFEPGHHMFTLSQHGVRVFPRLETLHSHPPIESDSQELLSTGLEQFDRLLHGGVRRNSMTLFLGPTGIGKTSFGMHFLSQCRRSEPGVYFGFYETRAELEEKASALGMNMRQLLRNGVVHMVWLPPTEYLLDQLGYALLEAVDRWGARRLFVDGVDAFRQAAEYPERLGRYFAALSNALRARGVTAAYTLEVPRLMGDETHMEFTPVSPVAQNIILLRYVERASSVCRTMTIIKTRQNQFDPSIRQFQVGKSGIMIGQPVHHGEASMNRGDVPSG